MTKLDAAGERAESALSDAILCAHKVERDQSDIQVFRRPLERPKR
jgi:hypothetical protein